MPATVHVVAVVGELAGPSGILVIKTVNMPSSLKAAHSVVGNIDMVLMNTCGPLTSFEVLRRKRVTTIHVLTLVST